MHESGQFWCGMTAATAAILCDTCWQRHDVETSSDPISAQARARNSHPPPCFRCSRLASLRAPRSLPAMWRKDDAGQRKRSFGIERCGPCLNPEIRRTQMFPSFLRAWLACMFR
jgi:hypothetical protein